MAKKNEIKSGIRGNGIDLVQVIFGGKIGVGGTLTREGFSVLFLQELDEQVEVGHNGDWEYDIDRKKTDKGKVELIFQNVKSIDILIEHLTELKGYLESEESQK